MQNYLLGHLIWRWVYGFVASLEFLKWRRANGLESEVKLPMATYTKQLLMSVSILLIGFSQEKWFFLQKYRLQNSASEIFRMWINKTPSLNSWGCCKSHHNFGISFQVNKWQRAQLDNQSVLKILWKIRQLQLP